MALGSAPLSLFWPSILFLLLSSLPSHPLSLMCASEKDVRRGVRRDFSELDCMPCVYIRARLRFARECVRRGREQEGRTERAGWDGNSCAAATTHRSTIGFRSVKCHVGITPRYDNQCELILILPCVHWFVPLSISPFFFFSSLHSTALPRNRRRNADFEIALHHITR